ncbi:MAG: glutaredoxin family protein [Betaproteobacteria bacterium]
MKRWVLIPVLLLACVAARADFYRWVDAAGEIHYSDQPPPANVKQFEKIKASGGKPADPPLPYVLQVAVKNFPVTLYVSECGDACTSARDLLAKRGIPYTEMDATDAAAQEELKILTGGPVEVPLLKVGREALRGFEEDGWNTSLDAAGYPRTAMIAPRPPNKPTKPAAAPAPVESSPAASASPPAKPAQ